MLRRVWLRPLARGFRASGALLRLVNAVAQLSDARRHVLEKVVDLVRVVPAAAFVRKSTSLTIWGVRSTSRMKSWLPGQPR